MGVQENRRDHRYSVSIPLLLVVGKQAAEVVTRDVSFRGLCVVTAATPPRLRELVRIRVVLPSGTQLNMQATVVRVTPAGEGHETIVGLQLFALDDDAAQQWRTFVGGLRTTSPRAAPVEQRRFKRFALVMQVRLESSSQIHDLFSQDLSLGGIFLDTPLPFPVGDRVVVQLIHPQTAMPFDLEGVVRRRVREGAARGIAVEFDTLSRERRAELASFIAGAFPAPIDDALPIIVELATH